MENGKNIHEQVTTIVAHARGLSTQDRGDYVRRACGADETLLSHVLQALGRRTRRKGGTGTRLLGRRRRRREHPRGTAGNARRATARPLSHRAQARLRRHGRRVPRRARRRGVSAAGRAEDRARRAVLAADSKPPAHGAADPRDAATSEHRAPARWRPRAGRHAVSGHGVHRRRAH